MTKKWQKKQGKRAERLDKAEAGEKPAKTGKHGKAERTESLESPESPERREKSGKTDKPERTEKKKRTPPHPSPLSRDSLKPKIDIEVDPDVLDFIAALDQYKKIHSRPFPSWSEVLFVVKQLGYKKSS